MVKRESKNKKEIDSQIAKLNQGEMICTNEKGTRKVPCYKFKTRKLDLKSCKNCFKWEKQGDKLEFLRIPIAKHYRIKTSYFDPSAPGTLNAAVEFYPKERKKKSNAPRKEREKKSLREKVETHVKNIWKSNKYSHLSSDEKYALRNKYLSKHQKKLSPEEMLELYKIT